MFLGGCPCCGGGTSKDEECCNCSIEMLQRDYWASLSGDYGEPGVVFDSTNFFEASVDVGWGNEVVWSGVLSKDLVHDEGFPDSYFFTRQPTSGVYNYTFDPSGGPQEMLYEEPIQLRFVALDQGSLEFRWGPMYALIYFGCNFDSGISVGLKDRFVGVRQEIVTPDTGGSCPLGIRKSHSNISGTDKQGNFLTDSNCGIADDFDIYRTLYTAESCGLGVVSKVFLETQKHGTEGDRPCPGPFPSDPYTIPQQYIKVTLTVKDKRLGAISPCYTSDPNDPDALDDGSTTGLCNGRVDSSGDDFCSIRRECECPASPPSSTDLYGKDALFLPGETTICKCCCFLSNANTATLDCAYLINEANATFQDGSLFDGLKALVFVTDGTDPNFGDEMRVIAMLAERNFGFTITRLYQDNKGYSFVEGEYIPSHCGDVYEDAYFSAYSCTTKNYLQRSTFTAYTPPVYRSQPFNSSGSQSFEEWKKEQTELALMASCNSPEWDWNFYIDEFAEINEYGNELPFKLTWIAGYSEGEGKTFSETFQTTDGPLKITGTCEITQTFDDECGYAGDCEFPTQTADTIVLPVTDEDCCTRGGGTFTPNPGGRTMSTTTKTTGGPGTELSRLLKMIGINAKEKGCGCRSHAKRMDREGPQWCRDNIETILGWLQTEAKKRQLPFVKAAAKQVVLLAIRRADIRK